MTVEERPGEFCPLSVPALGGARLVVESGGQRCAAVAPCHGLGKPIRRTELYSDLLGGNASVIQSANLRALLIREGGCPLVTTATSHNGVSKVLPLRA